MVLACQYSKANSMDNKLSFALPLVETLNSLPLLCQTQLIIFICQAQPKTFALQTDVLLLSKLGVWLS